MERASRWEQLRRVGRHGQRKPKFLAFLLLNADLPYRHFLLNRRELSFVHRRNLALPSEFLRQSKRRIWRSSVFVASTISLSIIGGSLTLLGRDQFGAAEKLKKDAEGEATKHKVSEELDRASMIQHASTDCDSFTVPGEKNACLIGAGIAANSLSANKTEDPEEIFSQFGVAMDDLPDFVRDERRSSAATLVEPNNPASTKEPSATTYCGGWIWLGRSRVPLSECGERWLVERQKLDRRASKNDKTAKPASISA